MSVQTYERGMARLEIYDKLQAAQQEIASGVPQKSHEEVFARFKQQYGEGK